MVSKKPAEQAEPAPKPQQETQADNGEFKEQGSSKNHEKVEQYAQKSIGIKNVLEDFKKTLAAIGAPQDINQEVETYLKLADSQSARDNPSPKIIRSNLKNAALLLDDYITQTLNKPSKVVTDWIDALLLQNINYKSEAPKIQTAATSQPEPAAEPPTKPSLLEKKYSKVEKLTDAGKFRKALVSYNELLIEAQNAGDKKLETKIYLDRAYIYDISKNFPKALENYNLASKLSLQTNDNKTHALAHYNMASIYDDFGKTELALGHYYEALSHDGEAENLKAQTHTLNDVGNVLASIRRHRQAIEHYQVGIGLTRETNDIKARGFLLSNIAGVFKDTGKDAKALKYYKKSIECDMKVGNWEGYSINHAYSGDIMQRNNQLAKADALYKKSLLAAQKLGDKQLSGKILERMENNSLSY